MVPARRKGTCYEGNNHLCHNYSLSISYVSGTGLVAGYCCEQELCGSSDLDLTLESREVKQTVSKQIHNSK